MLGLNPSIESTSGFSKLPKNCLAYALSESTYLLCPSAYIVLKASELLPLPLTPVITTNLFLGISISIFFRLFSLAPFIIILSIVYLHLFLFFFFCAILLYHSGHCKSIFFCVHLFLFSIK